jgi:hypothetical protein
MFAKGPRAPRPQGMLVTPNILNHDDNMDELDYVMLDRFCLYIQFFKTTIQLFGWKLAQQNFFIKK